MFRAFFISHLNVGIYSASIRTEYRIHLLNFIKLLIQTRRDGIQLHTESRGIWHTVNFMVGWNVTHTWIGEEILLTLPWDQLFQVHFKLCLMTLFLFRTRSIDPKDGLQWTNKFILQYNTYEYHTHNHLHSLVSH